MNKCFWLCVCALCLFACRTVSKAPGRVGQMYFSTISFQANGEEIGTASYKFIDEAAKIYKKNPSVTVEVRGYTDSSGKEDYNQRLSKKRADKVAQALQMRGVAAAHISAKGYGSQKPVASNNTPEGRQQNRRVEIEFPYPEN